MSCKNCGECCCSVAFTASERDSVKKIARKLGIMWKKLPLQRSKNITEIFYLPYNKNYQEQIDRLSDYNSLVHHKDIPCPFLIKNKSDKKTLCLCYDKRPNICRVFGTMGNIKQYLLCENFEKVI